MSESITKELRSVNAVTLEEIRDGLASGNYRAVSMSPTLRGSIADRIDARFTHELEAKQAEIDALKSDNAALQARLDASILPPLDADGVPCRIGDLLEAEEHIPRKAVGYYLADESTPCVTLDFVSPSIEASLLHHVVTEPPEPPDSQERIDADAEIRAKTYCGKRGIGGGLASYEVLKSRDLLRRQRELDGAGEQA